MHSVVVNPYICVSVCPRAYIWDRRTDLHEILCGRGSVLLWQHCAMLCTSGFMDDVTVWP